VAQIQDFNKKGANWAIARQSAEFIALALLPLSFFVVFLT